MDYSEVEMDGEVGEIQFVLGTEERAHELNVPLTTFRLIVCILGILGNLLVIFVILVLAEYKKAVTHWYVLQLAIADSVFLLTIPFRVAEDMDNGWNFPDWMCKAKETILFLNYYSSITFLVVMSIDRYIAVCHGFSSFLQKFRTPLAAGIITAVVWIVCLLICVPIMLYSTPRGQAPNCRCEYQFPIYKDINQTCLDKEGDYGSEGYNNCVEEMSAPEQPACTNYSRTITLSRNESDMLGSGDGIDVWDFGETTASPETDDDAEETSVSHILQPGCHYFDYADGFKAFIWFNFVVMFLIPLVIMSICYALIVMRLYGTRFRSDSGVSTNSSVSGSRPPSVSDGSKRKRTRSAASARNNRNRIRVTIMCASMVVLFFVCWIPFHAVHLAKMSGINAKTEYCLNLFYAVSLIAFANSAINPYVYNFIGTRFGKRLGQVKRTKTVKAFFSLASGKTGRHSTASGSDHQQESVRKRKQQYAIYDSQVTKVKDCKTENDDARNQELLLENYPVYTGPTVRPPPQFESLLKNEPPPYQEPSDITTKNEPKTETHIAKTQL